MRRAFRPKQPEVGGCITYNPRTQPEKTVAKRVSLISSDIKLKYLYCTFVSDFFFTIVNPKKFVPNSSTRCSFLARLPGYS